MVASKSNNNNNGSNVVALENLDVFHCKTRFLMEHTYLLCVTFAAFRSVSFQEQGVMACFRCHFQLLSSKREIMKMIITLAYPHTHTSTSSCGLYLISLSLSYSLCVCASVCTRNTKSVYVFSSEFSFRRT